MCVFVPFAFIAGVVWLVARTARHRHEERMAAIEHGVTPSADAGPSRAQAVAAAPRDPTRGLGWAAGLLVCGLMWYFGGRHFASILVGVGVAFLVRGIFGLRRDAASPDGSALPPGDAR
jgi:hypothetical protein